MPAADVTRVMAGERCLLASHVCSWLSSLEAAKREPPGSDIYFSGFWRKQSCDHPAASAGRKMGKKGWFSSCRIKSRC